MIKNEIIVHSDRPLTHLICGTTPKKIGKKTVERKIQVNNESEHIDLSAFPPLTTYKKNRPRTSMTPKRRIPQEKHPMTNYKKLREDDELVRKVTDDLNTYKDNHQRKALQIHQDWEERYMKPLQSTMKKKLNGYNYNDFVTTRTRATTALGTRSPYCELYDIEAASLPFLKIPTNKCEDRIHKYQRHAATEQKLTAIVLQSHGITQEPPSFKERKTIDVQTWRIMPDTRIFNAMMENGAPKGKRPFPEVSHSTISSVMDEYQ